MKKNIIIILLASLVGFTSCEDYLDASPEMGVDAEAVYSDYNNYKMAVDYGNLLVMNYLAHSTNWATYVGTMSDEDQQAKLSAPPANGINKGDWDYTSNWRDFGMKPDLKNSSDNCYNAPAGKSIHAIRAMCLAIENINKLKEYPAENGYTPEEMKNQLLGQAYFLRAWHYFEVIKRYGPMMLVDTTGGTFREFSTDYNFDKQRPSFQTCADMIASDCDNAAKYLPDSWKMPVDKGRVTKSSAMGLKGFVYMYAASPLMNTGDDFFPSTSNPFGQDSYNQEYAKKGIAAMCATLEHIQQGGTRYRLYNKDEYGENWMSKTAVSDEALFQPAADEGNGWAAPMNRGGQGTGWWLPQHDGGWAVFTIPTQNAVDRFETINGYSCANFEKNDPEFDPHNPYMNRDPRLRFDITCPGDTMYKDISVVTNFTNEAWSNANDQGYHYKFYSGKGLLYSGYFGGGKYKKLGMNKYDALWSQNYYRIFPHLRLADMYLGIAELANEVYGPTATIPEASGLSSVTVSGQTVTLNNAQDFLDVIRVRVGMPKIEDSPVYTNTKESLRDRVRNEWGVEFYGEFRRWRDIRRWRIAKEVLGKGINGVKVTKNSDGTFTYVEAPLAGAQRTFEDKQYWYPIDPAYSSDMFYNLKQNPNW